MDAEHRSNDSTPDRVGLDSREYRNRLLTKLNCLVAVLEVAIGKIDRNLESPGADEQRLERIRTNLENTLSICQRARRTLAMSLGREVPHTDDQLLGPDERRAMSYRDYVELSSIDEYRKFKGMEPITDTELSKVDVDELTRRLMDL